MEPVEEEVVSLFDDVKPEPEAVEDVVASPEHAETFDVPDKFKGKSVEDVIESYINLEKEAGRKANELGDLRKLTDQILQQQVAPPVAPVAPAEHINDVGFDDFVEDPAAAVNRVVADNPRLQALEASLMNQNREAAHARMIKNHPDADEVVASPGFVSWVQADPSRVANFSRAHEQLDIGTATDMISLYKQTQKVATEEAVTERDSIAKSQLKDATVETGSIPNTTKKVYRRADLINLKMYDPARYSAMSDDITKAYAEGRVK